MKPIKGPSLAVFQRDWRILEAAIGERMNGPIDKEERNPEQSLANSQLLRQFYMKHHARLEAKGIDVAAFLVGLDAKIKTLKERQVALEKAEEALLQAQADRTDAISDLAEMEFHILRFYESRTQEDMDKLTPEQRGQTIDLIAQLRAAMPAFLDSLPIEKRRELESLGPWEPSEGDPTA